MTPNKQSVNKKNILKYLDKLLVKQIIIGLMFATLLFIMIFSHKSNEKISVKIGDLAPEDIIAPSEIVDEVTTKEKKEEARDSVEKRFIIDSYIQVKATDEIKTFFILLNELIQADSELTKIEYEELQSNLKLNEEDVKLLLRSNPDSLVKLENYILTIINNVMTTGISKDELDIEKNNAIDSFNKFKDLSNSIRVVGGKIINLKLTYNEIEDVETTKEKREEAASKVNDILYKEGQIIVKKGEKINLRTIRLIEKTGLLKDDKKTDYYLIIGTILFILIFITIISTYLYILDKDILNNIKLLILLAIVILLMLAISKGLSFLSPFIIPVATGAMLISILINTRLAVLVNLFIAILIGFITGNDINAITLYVVGGTVAALGVVKPNQRYNILYTGLIVSCVNVLIIIAFGLIGNTEIKTIFNGCFYGVLNGILSSILTIGTLPIWEGSFGIVTQFKLLELSNANHPLLRELLHKTPGTYHHSIIVGNLSESAAEAIGANSLLARVGAYYHDVGKINKPYFFKENQYNGKNPHDKIKPSLSTFIIINHVKNGVELAKKHRLPEVIENIIREHHGTTLVKYFYVKSISETDSEKENEENYRYQGPKPQSKEAAIIMLADSVEAAVRAMQDSTKGKIEGLVRKIIKDKLYDGQLDECNLTLKDLDSIAKAFVSILIGIFHERIEYPNLNEEELKGAN